MPEAKYWGGLYVIVLAWLSDEQDKDYGDNNVEGQSGGGGGIASRPITMVWTGGALKHMVSHSLFNRTIYSLTIIKHTTHSRSHSTPG